MSWDKTYSHTLLIAADQFAAAVFFNEPDLCISTLCWCVRTPSYPIQQLKLSPWQFRVLMRIGDGLEHFWPGHCVASRQGDIDRAGSTQTRLGVAK